MKSLLEFLLESRGAEIKDRTWDRFFGDEYEKPVSVKKTQWKTKKFLKDFKEDISEKSFDFLSKLAVLRQEDFMESRSSVEAGFYNEDNWKEYHCSFSISANNIPESIENKLSSEVIAKKFDLELHKSLGLHNPTAFGKTPRSRYSCDSGGMGTNVNLYINYACEDKEKFFKVFNYIADALLDIADDILSFHDNYKDRDVVSSRRNRRNGKD